MVSEVWGNFDFKKEIRKIYKLFEEKKYFEVVIISVQLFELIAMYILYYNEESGIESAFDDLDYDEANDWFKVYKEYMSILSKYRGRESAKIKLIEVLYQDFEHFGELDVTPAFIQKVNRVFNFRKKLAHEYYIGDNKSKHLRVRAKDCVDVLERFYNHIYF